MAQGMRSLISLVTAHHRIFLSTEGGAVRCPDGSPDVDVARHVQQVPHVILPWPLIEGHHHPGCLCPPGLERIGTPAAGARAYRSHASPEDERQAATQSSYWLLLDPWPDASCQRHAGACPLACWCVKITAGNSDFYADRVPVVPKGQWTAHRVWRAVSETWMCRWCASGFLGSC